MAVLLVFPPRAAATYVPLGLATLAGHVRAHGESVRCLDLNQAAHRFFAEPSTDWGALMRDEAVFTDEHRYLSAWQSVNNVAGQLAVLEKQALAYLDNGTLEGPLRALVEDQVRRVLAEAPTGLGISVLYPSQVPFALALAKAVRDIDTVCPEFERVPGLEIVLGGASLSALHLEDLLLACPFVDAAVKKEGEAAVLAWCRGARARQLPGARFVERTEVVSRPNPPPVCLETAAFPDFSDFDLAGYLCPTPVLPVLFSRDCRYRRCRFCGHNFSSAGHRRLSPKRFVEQLASLRAETGARHFYLADQYVEAGDLEAIATRVEKEGLDIYWSVMARAQPEFTDEILRTLHRTGCVWMSWGLESGSQRLLDIAGKGTSVAVGEDVVRRAAAVGMSNLAMMIFSLPGSDDEAFDQTVAMLERLDGCLDATTESSFVLFEGTAFARRAEYFGLVKKEHQVIVTVDGRPVRSVRLSFAEIGSDGSPRPPRGPMEVAAWNKRRQYTCVRGFFDDLVAEHYLLFAAIRRGNQRCPRRAGCWGRPENDSR